VLESLKSECDNLQSKFDTSIFELCGELDKLNIEVKQSRQTNSDMNLLLDLTRQKVDSTSNVIENYFLKIKRLEDHIQNIQRIKSGSILEYIGLFLITILQGLTTILTAFFGVWAIARDSIYLKVRPSVYTTAINNNEQPFQRHQNFNAAQYTSEENDNG